jgi:NAD(P)-dependent dehydrogenase (short-subunit alcohol dehydrogenase family)
VLTPHRADTVGGMGALEGRVAIVTGAGHGLGRQHALVMAREGAKVVVNDLGGSSTGDGSDASPAAAVVEQIRAEGGEAVANHDDVSQWDAGQQLVDAALDAFGDLHVLVNNAGILRHHHLPDMTADDWDLVMRVHLRGHFVPTRAAAAHWRARSQAGEQVHASIVNTSSPQGLFGGTLRPDQEVSDFPIEMSQANYDAAKAGILGFTLSTARELAPYGVRVNAIAPIASTRLAELYPGAEPVPEAGEEWDPMHPRNNSFVVAWLATADCPATGTVWGPAFGGLVRYATWSEAGVIEPRDGWWTVEEVGKAASELLA